MTTPENIKELKEDQIFVFGSNLNGNHAGGAARQAKEQFGAEDGIGEGPTGQCYAFPTLNEKMRKVSKKSLPKSVAKLYAYAEKHKDKQFLVTKVGCGIAGFTEDEMKVFFDLPQIPENIILPAGWTKIFGYKAFYKGLTCRGFQYEFGKDFYHGYKIKLCESGFHFCKSLGDVYSYYDFYDDIVVCEVESLGDVIDEEDGSKSVTNHIRLIRMLNYEEASNNNGIHNTGHSNTGDRNTGNWNTGDRNTGNQNTGNWNTGNWNTGDRNTGDRNTGNWNTGDRNTGYQNTGNWNTGDRNTGYQNTGDRNTGDRNTGYQNTGNWNTGDRNTGNWNTGDRNTGSFNTITPDEILIFNKPCNRKIWENAKKPSCLYFNVNVWVDYEDMTEEEKKEVEVSKYTGGYVKKLNYKEAFIKSLEKASKEEISLIKKLPNFDADIFEEISGFRIK